MPDLRRRPLVRLAAGTGLAVVLAACLSGCGIAEAASNASVQASLARLAGPGAHVSAERHQPWFGASLRCSVTVDWYTSEPDEATYLAVVEGLAPTLRGTPVGACGDPSVRTATTALSVDSSALDDTSIDWHALGEYVFHVRPETTQVGTALEGGATTVTVYLDVPRASSFRALLEDAERVVQQPEALGLSNDPNWRVTSCSSSALGLQYCFDKLTVMLGTPLAGAQKGVAEGIERTEEDVLWPGSGFEGTAEFDRSGAVRLELEIYVDDWSTLNDAEARERIPGSAVERAAAAVRDTLDASGLPYEAKIRSRGMTLLTATTTTNTNTNTNTNTTPSP